MCAPARWVTGTKRLRSVFMYMKGAPLPSHATRETPDEGSPALFSACAGTAGHGQTRPVAPPLPCRQIDSHRFPAPRCA